MAIRMSVIIPARNAAGTIGGTLLALQRGTRQADEIIVADGMSTDRTAAIARKHGALVVMNLKQHAAGARQAGVEAAAADVVAFTDADCIPADDWLERIADQFQTDCDLDGVGGVVTLVAPTNEVQAQSATVFETIMQFPEEPMLVRSKGMRGAFAGANCAYRKAAIQDVGGFRDEFSNYAEEIDLFWRLIDQSARLIFDPSIRVEHLGYPDSLRAVARANVRYGIASTKLAKHHIKRARIDTSLYRQLARQCWRVARSGGRQKDATYSVVQLSSFIAGKASASLRERIVNL